MIYIRHNTGVIFAGSGINGLLHRWRMWRNDKFNRALDRHNRRLERNGERHKRYRRGFLGNQHDIDNHWNEDAPQVDFPEDAPNSTPLRVIKNPDLIMFWR